MLPCYLFVPSAFRQVINTDIESREKHYNPRAIVFSLNASSISYYPIDVRSFIFSIEASAPQEYKVDVCDIKESISSK